MEFTEDEVFEIEERAAILEYEALMPRVEAEECARHLVRLRRKQEAKGGLHDIGRRGLCGAVHSDGKSSEDGA